jgi:hypothetical protein
MFLVFQVIIKRPIKRNKCGISRTFEEYATRNLRENTIIDFWVINNV